MDTTRLLQAYDSIAPHFAAVHTGVPVPLFALTPRFLALAGPSARVLEVGCGSGRDMAWLEEQGVAVAGIDLSRGMLTQARQRTRGSLAQMDMRRLGIGSGQFTGVWCAAALLHLPKAEVPHALAEMAQVLSPGGALLVSLQEGEGEGWQRGFGDGDARRDDIERSFSRYQPAEITAFLKQAGFATHEQRRDNDRGRHWLTILATR